MDTRYDPDTDTDTVQIRFKARQINKMHINVK